jgi:hypothetical protein
MRSFHQLSVLSENQGIGKLNYFSQPESAALEHAAATQNPFSRGALTRPKKV